MSPCIPRLFHTSVTRSSAIQRPLLNRYPLSQVEKWEGIEVAMGRNFGQQQRERGRGPPPAPRRSQNCLCAFQLSSSEKTSKRPTAGSHRPAAPTSTLVALAAARRSTGAENEPAQRDQSVRRCPASPGGGEEEGSEWPPRATRKSLRYEPDFSRRSTSSPSSSFPTLHFLGVLRVVLFCLLCFSVASTCYMGL
ncbi:hypothetical protein MRX96_027700 [Rhipicephalus microplus]